MVPMLTLADEEEHRTVTDITGNNNVSSIHSSTNEPAGGPGGQRSAGLHLPDLGTDQEETLKRSSVKNLKEETPHSELQPPRTTQRLGRKTESSVPACLWASTSQVIG